MEPIISFFTDPWNIYLSQWTMKIVWSAVIQLYAVKLVLGYVHSLWKTGYD